MIITLSNPKTSKSYKIKTTEPVFINKKLGEEVDLSPLNLKGKAKITGGSTKTGFPMVPFIEGLKNKTVLLSDGLGFKAKFKGEKRRKTVAGNIISEDIEQVNLKIIDIDSSLNLDEMFPKEAKEKK